MYSVNQFQLDFSVLVLYSILLRGFFFQSAIITLYVIFQNPLYIQNLIISQIGLLHSGKCLPMDWWSGNCRNYNYMLSHLFLKPLQEPSFIIDREDILQYLVMFFNESLEAPLDKFHI